MVAVELIISLYTTGLVACLPAGALVKSKGPRLGAAVALLITTSSYLLLWSATRDTRFYHDNFWLLVTYFTAAGKTSGKKKIDGDSLGKAIQTSPFWGEKFKDLFVEG